MPAHSTGLPGPSWKRRSSLPVAYHSSQADARRDGDEAPCILSPFWYNLFAGLSPTALKVYPLIRRERKEAIVMNKQEWEIRYNQWEKFRAWERTREGLFSEGDIASVWNWYAAAWELARHFDPEWCGKTLDNQKIKHLVQIRNRLTHIRKS